MIDYINSALIVVIIIVLALFFIKKKNDGDVYSKSDHEGFKDDIIKDITLNQDLISQPGTKFIYSDLGMILLMDIAQKVTGRKFEDLVQSWLLNPMNMKNTYYNPAPYLHNQIPPTEIDKLFRKSLIINKSISLPIISLNVSST